jgi:hypothetical protein
LRHFPGRLHTVEHGHAHIPEDDVGLKGCRELERLSAVSRAPDDLNAAVELECDRERFHEEIVVVGDQHAQPSGVPDRIHAERRMRRHRGSLGKTPAAGIACGLAQDWSGGAATGMRAVNGWPCLRALAVALPASAPVRLAPALSVL